VTADPSGALGDAFDDAPCGYIVTDPDEVITAVNATMAAWLGYQRAELVGTAFGDLLTVGGRIHYETHFSPMLLTAGSLSGIAIELVASDGGRMPVLMTANVKTDRDGHPEFIRIVATDAADRRSYERELLAERRRAEEENARAVALAETLRYSLLPPALSPPAGLEAAAYYHSASAGDLGGDFYDLFPLSRDRYGFFLGDVCGKGFAAASLTSLTRYTLRAAAVGDEHPVAALQTLDSVLKQDAHAKQRWFCTVLFGVIGRRDDLFEVEIASGGHPPPLLLKADGSTGYVPTEGGQAAGLFAAPRFTSVRLSLSAGDTLVLYTDGFTEARIGKKAMRFDDEGALLSFVAGLAPSSASDVVAAMRTLIDELGPGVEDDAAVLALGVPS
jgi:sigma-B regulation protein RsbU (phosphoserine phosphatase)